jgi:hypothetical protein
MLGYQYDFAVAVAACGPAIAVIGRNFIASPILHCEHHWVPDGIAPNIG